MSIIADTFVDHSYREHTKDADCTLDVMDEYCVECLVSHGDPCPWCERRAFHTDTCEAVAQ